MRRSIVADVGLGEAVAVGAGLGVAVGAGLFPPLSTRNEVFTVYVEASGRVTSMVNVCVPLLKFAVLNALDVPLQCVPAKSNGTPFSIRYGLSDMSVSSR
jgi:hypothetical protein